MGMLLQHARQQSWNALADFARQLADHTENSSIAAKTVQHVTASLGTSWAGLLARDELRDEYTLAAQWGSPPFGNGTVQGIAHNTALMNWLSQHRRPVHAEAIARLPLASSAVGSPAHALAQKSQGVQLLCPIHAGNRFSGILLLGPKGNGRAFSSRDVRLLEMVAHITGIALDRARVANSLERVHELEKTLVMQLVQAEENERKRIACELHDGVVQKLVGLAQRLQTTLAQSNAQPVKACELAAVEEEVLEAVKELRGVLVGLSAPELEINGLLPALNQMVKSLGASLDCTMEVLGSVRPLSRVAERVVYRVVQEALNNVRKHSRASHVWVRLEFRGDGLVVLIRDNGCGFDVGTALNAAPLAGHMGLLGMKRRTEALGAMLSLESQPGYGTTLRIVFPREALE